MTISASKKGKHVEKMAIPDAKLLISAAQVLILCEKNGDSTSKHGDFMIMYWEFEFQMCHGGIWCAHNQQLKPTSTQR